MNNPNDTLWYSNNLSSIFTSGTSPFGNANRLTFNRTYDGKNTLYANCSVYKCYYDIEITHKG